jgi:hypothetical protein
MAVQVYQFGNPPDVLAKALASSLPLINAKSVHWSDANRRVKALIPFNFYLIGEHLDIIIGDDGRATIQSECAFPSQIIDWGKNRKNIEMLVRGMNDYLQHGSVDPIYVRATPAVDSEFTCPHCRSQRPPIVITRTAPVGYVIFIALLFACFPICWLGFFVKNKRYQCSQCSSPLG